MQIKRPDVIKVFGKNAMQGDYLPGPPAVRTLQRVLCTSR